ncbi:MAG: hypothetical protein V1934_05445 [Methanobacteriota archaeon]
MNKIAAIATALLILIPASAMFPLFARSAAPPGNTLFSRSYSNYTLDMDAPIATTGNGNFKFVLEDYSVKFADKLEIVFERIGFANFINDRQPTDGETSASYMGTDVQFVIHRIPTGAIEFTFSGANAAFFDLPVGMSALASSESGVVVGNGRVSSTLFLAGPGTLAALPGGILATVEEGSRILFRANPGQDSFVASSIAQGRVAGEVFATSSASNIMEDTIAFSDVGIGTIVTTNDTYTASVSGSISSGKVVIINVDRTVLPKLNAGDMRVEVGGSKAKVSDSLASILYETGSKPKYFVAADGDWLQVHVYVPGTSGETTITFEPAGSPFGLDEIASAMAAVVLVCVAGVALYRRE